MIRFASKPMDCAIALPPSATFAVRDARLKRFTPAGVPIVAVLQINERRVRGGVAYVRRYLLCELERDRQRRFSLCKPLGLETADGGRYHYVCVGYNRAECTCVSYLHRKRCVHSTILRTLLQEGRLPNPRG